MATKKLTISVMNAIKVGRLPPPLYLPPLPWRRAGCAAVPLSRTAAGQHQASETAKAVLAPGQLA
jgi:hypothetical protein